MSFDFYGCEQKIGYTFKDKSLLLAAFTHSSYSNEHKGETNNERLEFFGDSLLGFIVAEYFFSTSKSDEGVLTAKRQNVVSTLPLSSAIELCALEDFLRLGKGEKAQFKQNRQASVCEALFEAIVAAIYLDGGIEPAKKFVFDKLFSHYGEISLLTDYKSELQNYVQKNKLGEISYEVVKKEGVDHAPTFTVRVLVGNVEAYGKGAKKSAAEKLAAKSALEIIMKEEK